jgi:transketolase
MSIAGRPCANSPDMRTAFVNTLLALAKENPDVMLLTGDLGFTVLERFRDELPDQFVNAGVAEQNMIGMAAGLAMSGKRVFTYSIIPFTTFRCLEHIRNDLCYHNLPVCVVGVGGGYSYGHMGSTHHSLEDISVMRSLANMTVVCPGDPVEAAGAVRAISAHNGPVYLRLGKSGEPQLHADDVQFRIGKSIQMRDHGGRDRAWRDGKDVTIIATSTMLETGLKTAEMLKAKGVEARLLSMHTIKPIDEAAIERAANDTGLIVTIEEHSRVGGLGSAVAEVIAIKGLNAKQILCAAPDAFAELCGSQAYFRKQSGLEPDVIAEKILERVS